MYTDNQKDVKDTAVKTAYKQLMEEHSVQLPKIGDVITGRVMSVGKNEVYVDINGIATGIARGYELIDESGDYSHLSVGDEVSATVLEMDNEYGVLELSFRSAGHKKAWDRLSILQHDREIIQVKITEANKGGLMVTYGNVHGFMPVSQLCPDHYPRIQGGDKNKILEKLKSYIGQPFDVKVIDVNEEEQKLIVSEKAAWEDRQKDVISSYKPGDIIEGVVTVITDFGVFVKFGKGLEGLVHISELAWQRIDDPKDYIQPGQKIKASIIKIDGSKIFLSMKKLVDDPWKNVSERYKVGQKVKGKVLKVNPFGLFVELDPEIHGLAHISELSHKQISDPHHIAKSGDELDFMVVSVEPHEHRLGLSIKALTRQQEQKASVTDTEKPEELTKQSSEEKEPAQEARQGQTS
jgi:ribosomal protein S1